MNFCETPCDVIILAGQSNAQGHGLGECSDPYKPDERILVLQGKMPAYELIEGKTDLWYLEMEGCSEGRVEVAKIDGAGCFAHYFAREYVKNGLLKEGRKLLIVYAPVGGTGFVGKYWGIGKSERISGFWTEDGPLYQRMLSLTDEALRLNPENKIVGLLWHQGECDAWEREAQGLGETYADLLKKLIDGVKERYALQKLPVVCGEFVLDTWYEACKEKSDIVMRATENLMCEIGGGFVKATGLLSNRQAVGNGDNIHFSHESLRVLGERYFEAYKKIVK